MSNDLKLSQLHNQVFGSDFEIGGYKHKDKRRLEREKKADYCQLRKDWADGLKKPSVKARKSKLVHQELYRRV